MRAERIPRWAAGEVGLRRNRFGTGCRSGFGLGRRAGGLGDLRRRWAWRDTPAMKRSAIKIHSEPSAAAFSAPVNEVGPVTQDCPDCNLLSGKPFAARLQLAMPESPKDFIKRYAPRTEAKANTPRESPKEFSRRLRLRLVVPAQQQQQVPGGMPEH